MSGNRGRIRVSIALQNSALAAPDIGIHEVFHAVIGLHGQRVFNRHRWDTTQHKWFRYLFRLIEVLATDLRSFEKLVEGIERPANSRDSDLELAKDLWSMTIRPHIQKIDAAGQIGASDRQLLNEFFGVKADQFTVEKLKEFYRGQGGQVGPRYKEAAKGGKYPVSVE